MRRYGYTELMPPTTLVSPGTLVKIRSSSPLQLDIVCPLKASLGFEDGALLIATTVAMKLQRELSKEFTVNAEYLDGLHVSANYAAVKKMNLQFSNVKILEISTDSIFDGLLARSDGCAQAVRHERDRGSKLTMVKSVIQADVRIAIEFNDKYDLSADVKAELVDNLAVDLGLHREVKGSEEIVGTGLYWGLRDDLGLAAIEIGMTPPTGNTARTQSLIPTGRAAVIGAGVP